MRAFIWVGALAAAACGDVIKQEQLKADAAIDAPSIIVDAPPDAPDLNAPRVTTVTVPTGVDAEGGTGMVTATLAGPANTAFTVTFSGQYGSYSPPTVTVTTNASGQAMVATTYTTTFTHTTDGTEMSTATITVPSGAAPKAFQFPVVALKRQGNVTQYPGPTSFSPNYLLGEPITTTVSGNLKKFGFIYGTAGGNVKIGIYTNNASNLPGTLVAQLPSTAIQAGSVEVALPSAVNLPAGTYWFLGIHDIGAPLYYTTGSTNVVAYTSQPFANELPTTFPASPSTYSGQSFNWWFVIGQ